MLRTLKNS